MKFNYSIDHGHKKEIEAKSYFFAKEELVKKFPNAKSITVTRTNENNHYNIEHRRF